MNSLRGKYNRVAIWQLDELCPKGSSQAFHLWQHEPGHLLSFPPSDPHSIWRCVLTFPGHEVTVYECDETFSNHPKERNQVPVS